MINIGRPTTVPGPRPTVVSTTQRTLDPLGKTAGAMGQLKNSLGYRQAGIEGKERMENNLGAGRPVDVFDVGRYERDREMMKKYMEMMSPKSEKQGVDQSFLENAKKNFETNVY